MLLNLQVRDFAIVDQIDIEFEPGMTVLTGETGAGKSILVDALGLVLGERGSMQMVRTGARRAEFVAEFDVSNVAAAREWLEEQALDSDDECLLRRTVGSDGRSRAFINGNSVPLAQLKSLGELLLDIHGQHFHQSLGHRPVQRDLLDHFGGLLERRARTESSFHRWQAAAAELRELQNAAKDRAARLDLLNFQLQELEGLGLDDGEFDGLSNERQKLKHGSRLAEGVNTALQNVFDNDAANANSLLADSLRSLESLVEYDGSLEPVLELLTTAGIHIGEAAEALRRYVGDIDLDPARRDWVEERIDSILTVARKHRVEPAELAELTAKLHAERALLSNAEERGLELQSDVEKAKGTYLRHARTLSKARHGAASKFAAAVSKAMAGLGMPGGQFDIALTPLDEESARPWGLDDVAFLISANPGTAPQPLAKVASGGELSRMSLAIQVIASDGSAIPTMVFDEVDSGVGGGVAEMVGRRLQQLGAKRQVLCVTHLPQVGSLADHHFHISKVSDGKSTRIGVRVLSDNERIQELARMLGGVEITRKTLEHAEEMLAAGGMKKRA
ncbi:MAG: DNA repair protein RecN [Gammaproteobacteria bacterium]|nr:DNA repair protein RecN [Gammaproteobacteria bacterium]